MRGQRQGRKAWWYVLLDDDPEKIKYFIHKTQGENAGKYVVNIIDYGTVLKKGWGEEPPQEVKESMNI